MYTIPAMRHLLRHRNYRLIVLLAGLALFVRTLIPAGFMPDMNAGYGRLTICTATGPATIIVPDGQYAGSNPQQEHDNTAPHCPFALTNAPALKAPGAALAIPLHVAFIFAPPLFGTESAPEKRRLRDAAAPRAPPVFS